MRTFVCPGCGDKRDALATTMGHRCPSRKNAQTAYAAVDTPAPVETPAQARTHRRTPVRPAPAPIPNGQARGRTSVLTLTLEEAWRDIQSHHPEVPNVVVVVGPVSLERGTMDRYGHYTVSETWTAKGEPQHEVLIAAEGLGRGARQVFRTLLHESVHAYHGAIGVQGTTQRGRHNAAFRADAEAFGCVCDEDARIGCVTPDITDETAALYAASINRIDGALTVARHAGSVDPDALARAAMFLWAAWGHGWQVSTGGEGAWGILPRTRTRSKRAGENALRVSCECRSIRAFPSALALGPITCTACGSDFT